MLPDGSRIDRTGVKLAFDLHDCHERRVTRYRRVLRAT